MCGALLCLLSSAVGDSGLVELTTGLGLHAELELASRGEFCGDPVFARVTLRNHFHDPAPLPANIFRTVSYTANELGPYTYHFRTSYVTGDPRFHPIGPGEVKVINYQTLECPPVDEFTHDFWEQHAREGRRIEIAAHVGGEPRELWALFSNRRPTSVAFFRARPQEEMRFLTELYTEVMRRKKEEVPLPEDFDFEAPDPRYFGLKSFEPYPDLVEKLLAYEEHLSPGSLRDVVHVLGVARKLYYSGDRAEDERLVDELLKWLDKLPEIERHCLAQAIRSTVFVMYRDEPALNRLVYESIQRLPERLYEVEDYRASAIRGFSVQRPRFQAYVDKRTKAAGNE